MTAAARHDPIVVSPRGAVPGARITVHLPHFDVGRERLPEVRIADIPARVVFASERAVRVVVPDGVPTARVPVTVEDVDAAGEMSVAQAVATDLHQVDNPVFDAEGNLYVTNSGTRGQRVPVSVFRVLPDGTREPFVSGIVNATSMTIGPDGRLYVSSRFEGKVYRVDVDGGATAIGSDLGVSCGLAFASDGSLLVGDRSGTILRLDPATGAAYPYASLPPSVAAFHLALGPDDTLYATGPTLSSYDAVHRIDRTGRVSVVSAEFARPQGIVFRDGALWVVDAAPGWSGVYRLALSGSIEAIVAGTNLIGLAFDPGGGLTVCSNDTAYRFPKEPWL